MVMLKDLYADNLDDEGLSLVDLSVRNAERLGELVNDFLA